MYYTCLCCKDVCNESKTHDFMNDDLSRFKVMDAYKDHKPDKFLCVDDLIGKICKECFLAYMEFAFLWEENRILAEIEFQNEYECWKEEVGNH